MIFDSIYDPYKGVIVFCRIKEGTVRKGTKIRMMATGAVEEVVEVGYFGCRTIYSMRGAFRRNGRLCNCQH